MAELTTSGVSSAAKPIDHPEQPGVPAAGTPGIHLTESTAPIQPPVASMDPSDLATGGARSDDVITPVADKAAAYAARGHQIITDNLAAAKRLAAEYPQVAALLPAIESALHALFTHSLVGPDAYEPTPEQQAALAAEQVNAQAAADRQKLTDDHAAALEKIEADRVASLSPPVVEPAPPVEEPVTTDDAPIPPLTPSVFDPAPAA